jgi:threonyl-tRNA synthetase
MIIVGDSEVENESLSVRKRNVGDLGSIVFDEFLMNIKKEIKEKS